MKTITTMELAILFDFDFKKFNSMVEHALRFMDEMDMHTESFDHELFVEYYVLNRQALILFFKYLAEDGIFTSKERQIPGALLRKMMDILLMME